MHNYKDFAPTGLGEKQPGGLPDGSRGLRSTATIPPDRGRRGHDPGGSKRLVSFMAGMDAGFWHPAGVRDFWHMVPGVSLSLNPRLPSGTALPCACRERKGLCKRGTDASNVSSAAVALPLLGERVGFFLISARNAFAELGGIGRTGLC